MKIPFVDLHAQYLTIKSDIDAAMCKVIKESGFVRSRFVDEFESQWGNTIGAKRCVSCANGTDALYIAMRGLGLKAGDEVITSAHSWIASSETITQAGGRVVFCDTSEDTFTIAPEEIAARITNRTVGIIPVHLYGQSAEMGLILELAQKRKLWIIEDCAQAHLAEFNGRKVGTLGNAATFSFYPGKNLGAYGDAGCILTNEDHLADWCAIYSRHGGKGDHIMEGINSRLDGLQAAILSAKLPYLQRWTQERQRIAGFYDKQLSGVGDIEVPKIARGNTHVYHLYVIRTAHRDLLRDHLTKAGIATVLNYPKALPFYPAYAYLKHSAADFPVAHANQSRILSLPIYPEMTADQTEYVVNAIKRFFASNAKK